MRRWLKTMENNSKSLKIKKHNKKTLYIFSPN